MGICLIYPITLVVYNDSYSPVWDLLLLMYWKNMPTTLHIRLQCDIVYGIKEFTRLRLVLYYHQKLSFKATNQQQKYTISCFMNDLQKLALIVFLIDIAFICTRTVQCVPRWSQVYAIVQQPIVLQPLYLFLMLEPM